MYYFSLSDVEAQGAQIHTLSIPCDLLLCSYIHQVGRIPMPIDELCFIDEGRQVENLQGLDVRGNFARPMTASGRY